MPKFIDLTGQRFGRLVVIGRASNKGRMTAWTCRCDCGNHKVVMASNIKRGITTSCGCLHKELLAKRARTHGLSNSLTYQRWCAMHSRCKRDPYYKDVSVAPEWDSFHSFVYDMGLCPKGHSLERLNNSLGYSKSNCKWIPKQHQPKNTTRWVKIKIKNKEMILSDWCRHLGLSYNTVRMRLNRGWSPEEALGFAIRELSAN